MTQRAPLPPLLTLRAVTVQIPEYVLLALETIATDNGATLDDYLYDELLDFAASVCTQVSNRIDGYRSAYLIRPSAAGKTRGARQEPVSQEYYSQN
jgi:hypothetical protein